MIRSYYSPTTQISTEASGGRTHYTTRPRYLVQNLNKYECKFGETLWDLSDRYLGSENSWDIILDHNDPVFPYDLFPNKVLKLPEVVIENETTDIVVL